MKISPLWQRPSLLPSLPSTPTQSLYSFLPSENILYCGDHIKLADFGSCKGMYSEHPYTEYISTRWYRAPECLMTDGYYDYKVIKGISSTIPSGERHIARSSAYPQ